MRRLRCLFAALVCNLGDHDTYPIAYGYDGRRRCRRCGKVWR